MKKAQWMIAITLAGAVAVGAGAFALTSPAQGVGGTTGERSITYSVNHNKAPSLNDYYEATDDITGGNTGTYVKTKIVYGDHSATPSITTTSGYVFARFVVIDSVYYCEYYVDVMAMNPTSFSISFACYDPTVVVPTMTVSYLTADDTLGSTVGTVLSGSDNDLGTNGQGQKGLRFALSAVTDNTQASLHSCLIYWINVNWTC